MEDFKIEELDLYEILEINISSTVVEIKKAYRKKALQCHPDKNPDDINAAKKFHQLSKILEILTDEAARNAYDKVLKAKAEAKIRHQELDSKRRKLKEDLEAREKLCSKSGSNKSEKENLREEINRLRKEGSKEVEKEIENVLRTLKEEKMRKENQWDSATNKIKIKWKSDKKDAANGGYTQEMLHRFLSKYGEIEILVISPKKKGSALVEFKEQKAAEMAVDFELGLSENPLKLEWINGAPKNKATNNGAAHSDLIKETDFESVTLMNLRRAEERKRLIAQMMSETD